MPKYLNNRLKKEQWTNMYSEQIMYLEQNI